MSDEAIVRMGLDTGPLAAGLRGVEKSMEHTAEKINEQFRDVGREIATSLSLVGAIGLIENTFQKVQQIGRAAESIGVSTDFIQTIDAAGRASGIAGEQIEKMLDKFVQGLPAGTDVEKEFYDTANAIAAIEDPATRAQMAIDAFGKSGVKLIPILAQGKAGIQQMGEAFGKMSESEIKAVEDAHVHIEQFSNTATVLAGKLVHLVEIGGTGFAAWWKGIDMRDILKFQIGKEKEAENAKKSALESEKAARSAKAEKESRDNINAAIQKYQKHLQEITLKSSAATYEEKHAILDKRYQEAVTEAQGAKNDKDRVEAMTKMADLKEEILELEKKHTDEADKQAQKDKDELDRLQKKADLNDNAVAKAEYNLGQAQKSPYEFSLQELAQSNGFESRDARNVLQLRDWAKWNFMHGNFDLGEEQKNRAENIFGQMTKDNPYLQNPYERMIHELELANKKLNGVLTVEGVDD